MSNFVPSPVAIAVQAGIGSHTADLASESPGRLLAASRQERYLTEASTRNLHRAKFLADAQKELLRRTHGTNSYREK